MKKGIYINDSIHGLIPLSEYEKRIISSVGFNRLHDVYQNSTVYLTFPTNRTKRFEHSIGTMKLCSDMFFYSILNASNPHLLTFYELMSIEYADIIKEIQQNSNICEYKLIGATPDTGKMPNIKFDKLRHSLTPNNVPKEYNIIHLLLIQSIRAAALLHDIGHPPFSHVVEFALKSIYHECKGMEQTNSVRQYSSKMSKYFEDNKKLHEQMGDEISESILTKIIDDSKNFDLYEENFFEVLVLESVKRIFAEKGAFASLHRIIDSSLDGDRLDYITRDSINSGVDSGKIDYSRIIHDMRLFLHENEIYFCAPIKAVNTVEDFIKRRYNSYKDIIYHHRVIKTDYLLEFIVKDLVKIYLDKPSEPVSNVNHVLIPFDISGLWFPLGDATTTEKANALSQWNDSWLMTILKQIYYTEYYRRYTSDTPEYVLTQRLSELLCNEKNYFSLIKRSEDFKIIDDAVKKILVSSKNNIDTYIKTANDLSRKTSSISPPEGTKVDIKGTLDFIEEILKKLNGFVLSYISRHHKAIQLNSFQDFIQTIVEDETKKIFTTEAYYDTITVFKNISIGLDEPIYFYNLKDQICTLDEISGISDILRLDSDYLSVFYIYIFINKGDTIISNMRERLLYNIGTQIGIGIAEQIVTILNEHINQMEGELCVR